MSHNSYLCVLSPLAFNTPLHDHFLRLTCVCRHESLPGLTCIQGMLGHLECMATKDAFLCALVRVLASCTYPLVRVQASCTHSFIAIC